LEEAYADLPEGFTAIAIPPKTTSKEKITINTSSEISYISRDFFLLPAFFCRNALLAIRHILIIYGYLTFLICRLLDWR
jgi:hypothetical protein